MKSEDPRVQRTFTIRQSVLKSFMDYCHGNGYNPNSLIDDFMECVAEARSTEAGLKAYAALLRDRMSVMGQEYNNIMEAADRLRRMREESARGRTRPEYRAEVENQRPRVRADPTVLPFVVTRLAHDYGVLPEHVREDLVG